MKLLLLGRNGQVGWELQRSLSVLGEVVALDRGSSNHCGDLSNLEGLARTVREVRPDVIVNAAAYTAVDRAESEPELARLVNAAAPGVLAQEARQLGALLVHYSTDYVFDGSGSRPWTETDVPAPLSVYGSTKLDGERAIAAHCERHLILRTSWVYAARGGNFIRTMLRLAQERERLTVVDDQYGAPTSAELVADVTAHAIRQLTAPAAGRAGLAGIYHLAAAGETTWHGYASHLLGEARRLRPELPLKATDIAPVPSEAFVTAARRPRNSRLDTAKLREAFGLALPPWKQGVDRILAEIL
ncbi:dTDP-4-dehydrorhamnose reductase [Caenimonas terrae]|uniref:dTDP-4-dehydrorhamnose reductase n=1 Tax=Caenimonas terrae TaxID=696074 RepID=A0ABW0NFJ7_9BURK